MELEKAKYLAWEKLPSVSDWPDTEIAIPVLEKTRAAVVNSNTLLQGFLLLFRKFYISGVCVGWRFSGFTICNDLERPGTF